MTLLEPHGGVAIANGLLVGVREAFSKLKEMHVHFWLRTGAAIRVLRRYPPGDGRIDLKTRAPQHCDADGTICLLVCP